jgi:hypothetical protein
VVGIARFNHRGFLPHAFHDGIGVVEVPSEGLDMLAQVSFAQQSKLDDLAAQGFDQGQRCVCRHTDRRPPVALSFVVKIIPRRFSTFATISVKPSALQQESPD